MTSTPMDGREAGSLTNPHAPGVQLPLRVLVIDDSTLIRQRLLSLLNPLEGVDVVGQASTAEEGLAMIRALSPSVVTLDINLKGGNGLDILEQTKRSPETPTVIILTNYPYPAFRTRSRELGAEHFLTKSRDFHQIQSILEDLVTRAGENREGLVC